VQAGAYAGAYTTLQVPARVGSRPAVSRDEDPLARALAATTQDFVWGATFYQSTLAFNPLQPGKPSVMSLILRPSINMTSGQAREYSIEVYLPGFVPSAPKARDPEACKYYFGKENEGGMVDDPVSKELCLKETNGLHRIMTLDPNPHMAYERFSFFNTGEGELKNVLTLYVKGSPDGGSAVAISDQVQTEVNLCCVLLPQESPLNNKELQLKVISTNPLQPIEIEQQPIQNSPEIVRGNYWKHLQLQFNPPQSLAFAEISVIVESASDLGDQCRIVVKVPDVQRYPDVSGAMPFTTVGSDWLLFDFYGYWNSTSNEMTFFIRRGAVLEKGRQVQLRTERGEFRLPVELPVNDQRFTVEARSFDNVDEIIAATPVFQSDRVPHVRYFVSSKLDYQQNAEGSYSVTLTFRSNRPMFEGTYIYLKLPGFSTPITTIPLDGPQAKHFYQESAEFDIPQNLATLRVASSMFSDETDAVVIFRGMSLPSALYPDDPSLQAWTSDPNAERQAIDHSPEVGGGEKEFIVTELRLNPVAPETKANITFIFQPSIDFYEGNQVIFHLHGFDCPKGHTPLIGPNADKFGYHAFWDGESKLIMDVAPLELVSHTEITEVEIPLSANCMTPRMLSVNDGILTLESTGSLIRKEAIKISPAIGRRKFLTSSELMFEPAEPNEITKLSVVFTANADILPNSSIVFRLGGLQRKPEDNTLPRSGPVLLSGVNAPTFVGATAMWDNDKSLLVATVIPTVRISAGKQTQFFIERDQSFKLPYAMYQQDPSLLIGIPDAGIKMQPFNYTSRVNREGKSFSISELFYGEEGNVAYPNRITDLRLTFQPNVALREGSIIRIKLPGFRTPYKQVALRPLQSNLYDTTYMSFRKVNDSVPYATWHPETENLDFEVDSGAVVRNNVPTMIFLPRLMARFRVPAESLSVNDPRLTIQSLGSQIIREEQIKESDPVVPREFSISRYEYSPQNRLSTFLFRVQLESTVNITRKNPLTLEMPGFRNVLGHDNIHITGKDGYKFELPTGFVAGEGIEAAAQWNEERSTLQLWPKDQFDAYYKIEFTIEENQGFILPRTLYRNDERLTITSENNILPEPVKESPLIGDGPYENQRYCFIQYEKGTRTSNPMCRRKDCYPPLKDPCSPRELERCLCDDIEQKPGPILVQGFQLYAEDVLGAIPMEKECSATFEDDIVQGFNIRNAMNAVTKDRDELEIRNATSATTGYFRLCLRHFESVFDVGAATVRPACEPTSLVMVEGICVEHCPPSKIPIAGECLMDPVALLPLDSQAILVSLRMEQRAAEEGTEMFMKHWEDPERMQFVYQFQSQLAKYLNTPMDRFRIASVSNGSVIVNLVFVPAEGLNSDASGMTDRSPAGLLSVLRALQADESSSIYESAFFQTIDRTYAPASVQVVQCEDQEYRTVCPFSRVSAANNVIVFIAVVLGGSIFMVALCFAVWRCDADAKDKGESSLNAAGKDPNALDPAMQAEFARSWLESRQMESERTVQKREAVKDAAAIRAARKKGAAGL
jgi:hypothetical protein